MAFKHTEESKKKISEATKGRTPWNKGLKGFLAGEKHYLYGKTRVISPEWRKNMAEGHRGKKRSLAWRKKMSQILKGDNCYNWKGGITPEYQRIRASLEAKLWREAIYERDGYICRHCGESNRENLDIDHIKSFAEYPELRFELSNGRVLCKPCHRKTHTYARNARKREDRET